MKTLKDIELRSNQVQAVLSYIPHWMIRWGSLLFFLIIILILFISWLIKYPDIIETEVLITTEIPPQKEYSNASGVFDAILVENGIEVSKNQPLAIIENSANYEDVFLIKSLINKNQSNALDFYFPVDSIPKLFLGDLEDDYGIFINDYLLYRLNKTLEPNQNRINFTVNSAYELQNQLQNHRFQKDIAETELNLKIKDFERQKKLHKAGIISEQDYEQKQIELAQAKQKANSFSALISQTKESINRIDETVDDLEFNKIKENVFFLKNVIRSLNQLKNAIINWENTYVLKSQIEGKVIFLEYWNVNQYVKQGDLVFIIIPLNGSNFLAKLKAPLFNSGKIKKGQKINIKLENYPEREFGILQTEVLNISETPNTDGFYLIDAVLDNKLITSYNKKIPFKQEMIGSAEIITEDLRLLQRFFYQLREIPN